MHDQEVSAFEREIAAASTSEVLFAALDQLARATVGARLFTVMVVDTKAMVARRAYTSHPVEYPVSGTKPVEPNAWFRQVVENRNVFAANTAKTIEETFPDHALIASLGCGAVINIPIVLDQRVAATINLLDEEGAYPPDVVTRASEVLAGPAEMVLARIEDQVE